MKKTVHGENNTNLENFFNNKKILLTGHTGFKGSWLSLVLNSFGSKVCGVALAPVSKPNLFEILNVESHLDSNISDIIDFDSLYKIYNSFEPDIVIHMAAQALVSKSYENPIDTYKTNVIGTATLFDVIRTRTNKKPVTILNVTTDKVYKNKEWYWPYKETDELSGLDPYSNSKSCVELLSNSYYYSFFQSDSINLINARAGNVIGGGDFSENRIVPDCIFAIVNNDQIHLRNPNSIRPYQHVLEPLFVYLELIKKYYNCSSIKEEFNIGPSPSSTITTKKLAELIIETWPSQTEIVVNPVKIFKESNLLKLDSSKLKTHLNWSPKLSIFDAVKFTTKWYKTYYDDGDILNLTKSQISEYSSKYYEK